jgi:hypothetical protein
MHFNTPHTQVEVLPGQLEVLEERDDHDNDEYTKQKHEARKRQMAAKPSPERVRRGGNIHLGIKSTGEEYWGGSAT